MTQKKAFLALLLAMTLLLSGCSLVVKDEAVDNAREVIRVGDVVFTKGDVQQEIDTQLEYMQLLYNMYYNQQINLNDPALLADARSMVLESMTQQAVLIAKAKELRLDELTADEAAQLEQAVAARLAQDGVSDEDARETELLALMDEKLQAYAIKDVTVSEEQVRAEFADRVAAEKAEYADNLSAYGVAVLEGRSAMYRPAGYRLVKQILIQYAEADQALIDEITAAQEIAASVSEQLTATLTDLGATNIDELTSFVQVKITPAAAPTAQTNVELMTAAFPEGTDSDIADTAMLLAESQAKEAYLAEQLTAAHAQGLAAIDAEADAVLAALAAGEDWDTLSAAHNDDPGMTPGAPSAETGYPVCDGFVQFDPAFVDAAMGIAEVGGWSDKTPGSYGYYIIRYAADVVEGETPFEDVQDTLTAEVLALAQDNAYRDAVAQWVAQADIRIDETPLND